MHPNFLFQICWQIISQFQGSTTQETTFPHKISTFTSFCSIYRIPIFLRIINCHTLCRKTRPERTVNNIILTPMVFVNRFQHCVITHEWRKCLRIKKKTTITRPLERKIEFPILVIDKTTKTIYNSWSFRKSYMYGVLSINNPIPIHITITDISGHS